MSWQGEEIGEEVYFTAFERALHGVPVNLGDVAKGTAGKLREDKVVHLTGIFVDVAPSLARPAEVGMPLP